MTDEVIDPTYEELANPSYFKELKIKAVIIFDDAGNYFIHGVGGATAGEMFKAMLPLWEFNPEREAVHAIELDLNVPNINLAHTPHVK